MHYPGLKDPIFSRFVRTTPASRWWHVQTDENHEEHLAGFIVVWTVEDEAHIGTVAVDNEFRRQGIAQKLISAALQEAGERGAEKVYSRGKGRESTGEELIPETWFYRLRSAEEVLQ